MSGVGQSIQPDASPRFSWEEFRRQGWPVRILSALAALAVPTILIILAGQNPLTVYREMFTGLTIGRLADALFFAAILIVATASAMLTFNASLWNIGIEGQMAIATIGSTAVLLMMRGAPTLVLMPSMILGGAALAGFWAFLVALFKLRGVHEIFSGFALNQVAGALVKFMLLNIWWEASQRRMSGIPYPPNASFGTVGGFNVIVITLALLILVGVYFALTRTPIGLKVRAVGLSRTAASYYGVSANRIFFLTLIVGGAVAGIAGVITASDYFRRFAPDITSNFGFTAILIYLIARMNLLATIVLCVLFGIINAGTVGLQIRLSIDPSLALVIQSSIIFALFVLQGSEQKA